MRLIFIFFISTLFSFSFGQKEKTSEAYFNQAALEYINKIGLENIAAYENELLEYATEQLGTIPGLQIYGQAAEKIAVISFNVDGIHPYDIGSILDKLGIAVRTGHHCAQPIMDFYKIPGTVRASFAFYNTREEIDLLVAGVKRALSMLQ